MTISIVIQLYLLSVSHAAWQTIYTTFVGSVHLLQQQHHQQPDVWDRFNTQVTLKAFSCQSLVMIYDDSDADVEVAVDFD